MIAIKDYKAIYEYRQRRKDRVDGKRLDDEWKTIKGTHVMIDDEGSITKGPEKLRNLSSKKPKSLTVGKEMSPINSDYVYDDGDTEDDFTHKNLKKLKKIYDEQGMDAVHDEWYKFRMADSTKDLHQISKEEADEVMYDNVRQSIYDGWFRAADSSYKPQLTDAIVKNPEMRNAALNLAYENYRHNTENPLSFEEFLVTPIKMYRGEKGQKHVEDDIFDAYTFDKKMADYFAGSGGTVTEASIRPIDTYGSMRAVGEAEIWVPRQLSPVGYKGDSREDGITWERYDPLKWALEDYKEENDSCEDLLDSIIQEAEMVKLFDGSSKESDRLTKHRCIESIQIMVLQLTAKLRPQHEDSAFFAGELNSNLGERSILYPEVDAFKERRQKRLDARADEEGRWVTTEEKHKIHINEEGVPDKGNPHVIATMKGEGKNPKTRAEVITARVKKNSAKIKDLAKRVNEKNEAHEKAIDEKYEADKELKKAKRGLRRVKSHKDFIKGLGYKEGDKNKMLRESDDLQIQMDKLRDNRPVFKLSDEEKAKYTELESRKNQVDYAAAVYDDCFGSDAFTREKVTQARERSAAADKKMRQAEKEYRQARKELKQKAKNGDINKARLYTDEERASEIKKVVESSQWGDLNEEQRNKAMEAINGASDAEIQLLSRTFDKVRFNDSYGATTRGGSTAWYTPKTGAITLSQEDMGKPKTVWHEFGHFLDDAEVSGCDDGETRLMGSTYKDTLSHRVSSDKILHSEKAAADMQKLLDEEAPGKYRIESSNGTMLRVYDIEKGEYVDATADMSYDYYLSQATCRHFHDFTFRDKEYDDYLRSIGYPMDSEMPKYSDYMETYTTPKRKLEREREKYPGAEKEYMNKMSKFHLQRNQAIDKNLEEYRRQTKAYDDRCTERGNQVGAISDIMCGMMRGKGAWIYGCHGEDYYSVMDAPAKEAVAHYHQMRVMGSKHGMELLKSLLPSVAQGLEEAYNEWLWRNVDV